MIIGHGDIASVLLDRPDRLYFASGVSNSAETRAAEFQREKSLLLKQDRAAHLIYFSSLCVFYSNTPYAFHKLDMERIIKHEFPRHCIVRLGNITWGRNPHTLLNHLRDAFVNVQPVELRDVYRYIISLDEFRHWLELIPPWTCEMNMPGRRLLVKDIYQEYVVDALKYA